MSSKINAGKLSAAVMRELTEYTREVADGMKQATRKVALKTKREIVRTAPRRDGDYAKSWRVKESFENTDEIRITIHSEKEYRLTHLLEKGHDAPDGSFVAARPHIKPAEEKAAAELEKKVKVIISGGNS